MIAIIGYDQLMGMLLIACWAVGIGGLIGLVTRERGEARRPRRQVLDEDWQKANQR